MSRKSAVNITEKYNRILEGVQFQNLYLASSSASLKARPSQIKEMNADMKYAYEPRVLEEGGFIVKATFKLTAKSKQRKALEAVCSFDVEFSSKTETDEEFLKHFSNSVVRFLSIPYAREFFASMTSRMGLPAFQLPLLKIPPPKPASE